MYNVELKQKNAQFRIIQTNVTNVQQFRYLSNCYCASISLYMSEENLYDYTVHHKKDFIGVTLSARLSVLLFLSGP